MQHNVLITSAGKRTELLLEFKKEVKREFADAKVIAVDLNPKMSPACRLADLAIAVPRVTSTDYVDYLVDICSLHKIGIVVPTIDTELKILADSRDYFLEKGIAVMVSDADFISVCRDKRKTMDLFDRLGIRNPQPRDKYNPEFPMFAKPYDGSLSTNIHVIRSMDELTSEVLSDPKLIFMEYIDKNKYKEYTVDMYYDHNGQVKGIIPRERIEVRGGEVNKGATRKNYIVGYLKERMSYMPGVRGCICIQLFYSDVDNDVVGIEINPRYGGGYPLSYYAGANFPRNMIREYVMGEGIEYSDDWQDNTLMLRYDTQVISYE